MSKIISKEQIKEALDRSIDGVSGTPGYLERFAREIEKAVIKEIYKSAAVLVGFNESDITVGATEQIDKLKQDRDILLAALIKCDEAMDYISEWDIPIALPERVKEAIAQAKGN